jgi:hypothetical protein
LLGPAGGPQSPLRQRYDKDKAAEKETLSQVERERHAKVLWEKVVDNTRRIERNARAGYHYVGDPEDTSPLGVLRFEAAAYDKWNDEDFLSVIRDRFYHTIPKEKFFQWARDPYGQEKIDAYLKETAQPKIAFESDKEPRGD